MKTKCLLYCTMRKPELWSHDMRNFVLGETELTSYLLNGTIVAECEVECEEIKYKIGCPFPYLDFENKLKLACLTYDQLEDYLFPNNGYALHISNLKVFDKPLKLNEFNRPCQHWDNEHQCYSSNLVCCAESCRFYKNTKITKAPQNMMWAWYKGERYCLISIRPQWLCKILNGEKPIEVRKKVLKGMI